MIQAQEIYRKTQIWSILGPFRPISSRIFLVDRPKSAVGYNINLPYSTKLGKTSHSNSRKLPKTSNLGYFGPI